MLVLSRLCNEKVFLTLPDGRKVTILVVETQDARVRLGIDAPKDVQIVRDNAKKTAPQVH